MTKWHLPLQFKRQAGCQLHIFVISSLVCWIRLAVYFLDSLMIFLHGGTYRICRIHYCEFLDDFRRTREMAANFLRGRQAACVGFPLPLTVHCPPLFALGLPIGIRPTLLT